VLHAFHEARRGSPAGDDRRLLIETAAAVQDAHGLDAAGLLPFRAAFEEFADGYVEWLHEREVKEGWQYEGGELERRAAPPELAGIVLDGRIDRVDRAPDGRLMVVDYKTGNAEALVRKVSEPLEDTQLAFYAALLAGETPDDAPRAIYLALEDRKKPRPIEHPEVARSASQLVDGLAADFDALRAGAGAAALGEGEACEHCDARGLCRRDHWSDTP
jgi:ATP-dependent helicase/nuclease subunit B